ncbi:VWD domain-containing protein [Nocardioides sp. J2M5]|uniref:VWD domain-containing protein n=1 Tax=Nocardioides palaemonis TaxID=2829810 RepID=UPI001BA5A7D6|nr:VWD domain-containing protein [Nocardioides palaemonis]MBS2937358.1 VWD domain-containing protein [Nocardioides palaemonis]
MRRDLSDPDDPRLTRARLARDCLTPESLASISVYLWYQCGSGPGRGVEAIAQARFIAANNDDERLGHVSPNIQWEVQTSAGTADIVLYPVQNPVESSYPATDGPAEVIEVKQEGTKSEVETQSQANRYRLALTSRRGLAEFRNFAAHPYSDTFKILHRRGGQGLQVGDTRCVGAEAMLATYDAKGLGGVPGVLWVTEDKDERQCLDAEAAEAPFKEALAGIEVERLEKAAAVEAEGFNGSIDELIEVLAQMMQRDLARILRNHAGLLTARQEVLHLTARQVYILAQNTEILLRNLVRREGAAVGGARVVTTLEGNLLSALNASAKVGARGGPGMSAAVVANFSAVEARTAAAAAARAPFTNAMVGALERALLRHQAFVRFAGLAARYVGIGVPIVGWVMTAWSAWEMYQLARDSTEIVSWGDPHLVTLDKRTYDLQAVGEFTLAANKAATFEVQGRYVSLPGRQASVMDALAVRTGENTFEIDVRGRLLVDGEETTMDELDSVVLDDGSVLFRKNGEYGIVTDEDITLLFDTRDATLRMGDPNHQISGGLLGSHDGDPGNDIASSSGVVYDNATPGQIHGPFANSWRVTDESSLFTYAESESTTTFTDLSHPDNIVTAADFAPVDIESATDSCRNAGVEMGPQFDDCVFDLLVTGQTDWADVAAGVTGDLSDPNTRQFDPAGVLVEDFDATVAPNFAHPLYLDDPATSRVAGPLYDRSKYGFYVVDVPRHEDVSMSLRLVAYGDVDSDPEVQSVDVIVDGRALGTAELEGTAPAWSGPGTFTVADSGSTAEGRPFRIYELSAPLDNFGDAVKVRLSTRGFTGANGLAAGLDQVALTLITTPSQPHAISLPVEISDGIPTTGAGNIETRGGQDEYQFSAAEGSSVYVAKRDVGTGIKTILLDSSGTRIPATGQDDRHERFDELSAGTYTLAVRATTGPTEYKIGLSPVPEDATAVYQVGGTAAKVTTTAPGQEAWVVVPAVQGQQLMLQIFDSTFAEGTQWTLIRPSGAPLLSRDTTADTGLFTVTETGDWRIQIRPRGPSTGSVKIAGWELPATDTYARHQLDDPVRVVETTAPGQNAVVTFHGEAGQRVQMKTTESTYGSDRLQWRLIRPDGRGLVDRWDNQLLDTTTLDQTGTWRVEFNPSYEVTGSVKWRAWTVPADVEASAALDDPVRVVETTAPGQNAVVTFHGEAGQRVQMKTTESTYGSDRLQWRLIRPDGRGLVDRWDNQLLDTTTLDQTGTWRVEFNPSYEVTGSVKWRAWTVPADVEASAALDDPVRVVETTAPGQNAVVTFHGEAGQRVQMKTTESTYGSDRLQWRLIRPDGRGLVDRWDNQLLDTTTLDQTGTWRVEFNPSYEVTGSVKWRAWTVPADVEASAALDDPVRVVETTAPGQNAVVTFHGEAGQRVQMKTTESTYGSDRLQWRLIRPDGRGLVDRWDNQLLDTTTLDHTGTWRVEFNPSYEVTGSVKWRAWTVPD